MKKSGALLSTILAVIMLTVMLCPVLRGTGSSIIVDHNNATRRSGIDTNRMINKGSPT